MAGDEKHKSGFKNPFQQCGEPCGPVSTWFAGEAEWRKGVDRRLDEGSGRIGRLVESQVRIETQLSGLNRSVEKFHSNAGKYLFAILMAVATAMGVVCWDLMKPHFGIKTTDVPPSISAPAVEKFAFEAVKPKTEKEQ